MTQSNLKAWQIRADDYPVHGSAQERLRFALNYAILAPSTHNTQPWRFHLEDGSVELFAERRRALPVIDPDDRELVMACGAALCNLLIALHHYGWGTLVEQFPEGPESDLLARVSLAVPAHASCQEHRLFDCIPRRHACYLPFDEDPVGGEVLRDLARAASQEGARLVVVDDLARVDLIELVEQADRELEADPAYRKEFADWMRANSSRQGTGVPGYSRGLGNLFSWLAPAVERRFDLGKGHAEQDRELAWCSALVCVLASDEDTPLHWLMAGRALQNVLLTGVSYDLQASTLNPPLHRSELRTQLTQLLGLAGHPQAIVRMGRPPATVRRPPTPRLAASDVME
ncbi:MAG: nitroreductase family protein [Candidatus Eremiobacteraeota bacterium]|nr:nitroreductase family protein [Candidatus Eremiobacteraeota bacterium]